MLRLRVFCHTQACTIPEAETEARLMTMTKRLLVATQSTNSGGKQMRMAVYVMRGGGATRGGGGREAVKPPEAEASAVKRPAAEQEPEASGISG